MNVQVLFEDNHFLVLNKPPGLLVHGDQTGDETLLDLGKKYIKDKYEKPGKVFLGVTHRLDRPASGVVILARTSKSLARTNDIIKKKQIRKHYFAITKKKPATYKGKLSHYLRKDHRKNRVFVYKEAGKDRKLAQLKYNLISESNGYSLFAVELITGRSHQIRAQFSSVSCPLVGDLKYGYPDPLADKSIALHCAQMEFIHPVKREKFSFRAPSPNTHPWKFFGNFLDNYTFAAR